MPATDDAQGLRQLGWLVALALGCALPAPNALPALPAPVTAPPPAEAPPFGACTVEGWCWENPLPRAESLRAVWGSAPNDYWALGTDQTLLHFDGRRWSVAERAFRARLLFGRASDDVWAIGNRAVHWDGQRWSETAGLPSIGQVTGGFAEDGTPWVIEGRGGIWRYDGASWREHLPSSCTVQGCSWYTYRTASGGTLTPRPSASGWDGSFEMRALPDPTGRRFGGTRESHLLLSRGVTASLVRRWQGGQWQELPAPDAATPRAQRPLLRSLWGASDDDAWAVGKDGALLHFDGTQWTALESGTRADLTDIWGTGHDDVWVVGERALLHWDGHGWQNARPSATPNDLHSIWAVDECEAWAAGSAGTLLHRDCRGWSAVATGVKEDLFGVWAADSSHVWAVGAHGTLLSCAASGCTRTATPTERTLHGVWGSGANDVWAVGDGGVLLHFDGQRWTQAPSPARETLLRVRGSASDHVLAVGEQGAVLSWDGSRWQRDSLSCSPSRGTETLTSVLPLDGEAAWLLCQRSGPVHWGPGNRQRAYLDGNYRDLTRVGETLFIAGDELLERPKNSPARTISGLPRQLRALGASPQGRVFAVGDGGVILSRAPR